MRSQHSSTHCELCVALWRDVPDFTSTTASEALAELLKEGAGGKDDAKGREVSESHPVCGVQPENWALVGRIMTPATRVTNNKHHCCSNTPTNNPTCAKNMVFWQRNAMTTLRRACNTPRTNILSTATDVQTCATTPTPCVPMPRPAPSQTPPLRVGKEHIRTEWR